MAIVPAPGAASTFTSPIQGLPPENLFDVLSYLKVEDVVRASMASKAFSLFTEDSGLWKLLFSRNASLPLPATLPETLNPWKDLCLPPIMVRGYIKKKKAQITALPGHTANVATLRCADRLLCTGDVNGAIKVSIKGVDGKFTEVQSIPGCQKGIFQLCANPDQLFFSSGTSLKVYGLNPQGQFEEIQDLIVDGHTIKRFKIEKEFLLISSQEDNTAIFRRGAQGQFEMCKRLPGFYLSLVSGDYLFAVSERLGVRIWKRDGNGVFHRHYTDRNPHNMLQNWIFFENGHLIIADVYGSVKIWKEEVDGSFTGPKVVNFKDKFQLLNPVTSLIAQGDYIFAGMLKGNVKVLKRDEIRDFELQSLEVAHTDRVNHLSLYENYLISGSTDGSVKICEKIEDRYVLLQTLTDPDLDEAVTQVCMQGSKLFVTYATGQVKEWDFLPSKQ